MNLEVGPIAHGKAGGKQSLSAIDAVAGIVQRPLVVFGTATVTAHAESDVLDTVGAEIGADDLLGMRGREALLALIPIHLNELEAVLIEHATQNYLPGHRLVVLQKSIEHFDFAAHVASLGCCCA